MNEGTLTGSLKFYRFKAVRIYKFYNLHGKSLNVLAPDIYFELFIEGHASSANFPVYCLVLIFVRGASAMMEQCLEQFFTIATASKHKPFRVFGWRVHD